MSCSGECHFRQSECSRQQCQYSSRRTSRRVRGSAGLPWVSQRVLEGEESRAIGRIDLDEEAVFVDDLHVWVGHDHHAGVADRVVVFRTGDVEASHSPELAGVEARVVLRFNFEGQSVLDAASFGPTSATVP